MCGRFALDIPTSKLKLQFGLDELEDIYPRYNIAPGQPVLFLCKPENSPIVPLMPQWGLIPFWAKDKKIGHSLTNARAIRRQLS